MSVAVQCVEACGAMAAMDAVGTLLVVAESRGADNLAGALDSVSTPFKMLFYGYDSGGLIHGHGILGLLWVLPVMATDFFTTKYATRFSRRIRKQHEAEVS